MSKSILNPKCNDSLYLPCMASEKGDWRRAAKRCDKNMHLANWATMILNAAAAESKVDDDMDRDRKAYGASWDTPAQPDEGAT